LNQILKRQTSRSHCSEFGNFVITLIRTLCILSGIVFVVDSADKEALPEAKEELHTILNNNKLAGVPLMIMANKQDLQGNSYHLHYIIYTS
jgi:signal recognition particle receptor subunit beta